VEGLMDDYEIRKYDLQFKNQLLQLQAHHWGRDNARNAAYFEWKYERNPYMEMPSIFLALKDEVVVGMLGMYGAKWEFGKDRQISFCPCPADVVVHPAHRRKGLFKRLMLAQFQDLTARGFVHTFALSAGTMSYPGLISLGWKSIGSIETMRRHQEQNFKRPLQKLKAALRLPEPRKKPFFSLDQVSGKRGIVIQKTARPEQMSQLVKRLSYDGRIRHVRDAPYFAWRFQNPFSQYRFLFYGSNVLDGYLVLQASYDSCKSSATIVDWEASTLEIRIELIQAALECGLFEDLFAWSAMLSDDVRVVLRDLGFKPVSTTGGNHDSPVLVRPLQDIENKENWKLGHYCLFDRSSWDLRWVYSDHCR
jgi:GNAT superfamily N-acetyltransferase